MAIRSKKSGKMHSTEGISSNINVPKKSRSLNNAAKRPFNTGQTKSRRFIGKIEELKNHFKSPKKLVVAKEIAKSFGISRNVGLEEYAFNLEKYLKKEDISTMPAVSIVQLVREMQKKGLIEVK